MSVWKNLHFRPPILKPIENGRVSDKILIRSIPGKGVSLGHIVLSPYDDSFYHMVLHGYEETMFPDTLYEWTEVPT